MDISRALQQFASKSLPCVVKAKGSFKPRLSMKILSINNFTAKLLSKLLSDLSIGVHLEVTT